MLCASDAKLASSESVLASAELLADNMIQALTDGCVVKVSFAGKRGLPSSYFNIILRHVVERFGYSVLQDRVAFEFDSKAQRLVFDRSMQRIRALFAV